MKRKYVLVTTGLIFSVLLAACSPVRVQPVAAYTISPLVHGAFPTKTSTMQSILVTTPIASPGYTGVKMLYMMTPYALRPFAYHRWVAPPAQLIGDVWLHFLQNAGYFRTVIAPPYRVRTDYRLDTHLALLRQEFLEPVSQVHLALDVSLFKRSTQSLLASRHFELRQAASGNTPYSGVLAINRAVAAMASSVSAFCKKAVRLDRRAR